jgi:hypothetical protein
LPPPLLEALVASVSTGAARAAGAWERRARVAVVRRVRSWIGGCEVSLLRMWM